MEGLIPFVIHAIKKRRERSSYRCLSTSGGGGGSSRKQLVDHYELTAAATAAERDEGSSRHRRALSEFPPIGSEYFHSDLRAGASRSLREETVRSVRMTAGSS